MQHRFSDMLNYLSLSPEDFAIVEIFCFMDTISYLFKKERFLYNYSLCKVLKALIIAPKLFIWVSSGIQSILRPEITGRRDRKRGDADLGAD